MRPNVDALEFDPVLAGLLDRPPVRIDLPYGTPGPWPVSRYRDILAVTNDRRLTRAPLAGDVEIPRLMPAFTPPPDAVQLQDPPRASDLREAMGKGINAGGCASAPTRSSPSCSTASPGPTGRST